MALAEIPLSFGLVFAIDIDMVRAQGSFGKKAVTVAFLCKKTES